MKASLVARPIPILGESPASVLMRAVEGNGYRNLQALIWAYWRNGSGKEWSKASYVDTKRYGEILESFGISVTEQDAPCFSRAGPTSESPRLLAGIAIPEKLFREDGRYYCPECLKKRKYWRKTWTLRPFAVCPDHRKFLLRDCPACGAELHAWRGKLLNCDCGADLSAMKSEPADPAVLNWWLDCHSRAGIAPHIVDALILGIQAVDGGDHSPKTEYGRLGAAHDWLAKGVVSPYISELVEQRSEAIHPRIQMLPLLRSEYEEIRALARAILKAWTAKFPGDIPLAGGAMQYCEAELALGVSRFQFNKFRQLGLVGFPDRGSGGDGRVSLDAINRILYGVQALPKGGQPTEGRHLNSSVAAMVQSVLAGTSTGAGYDIESGLTTLRLISEEPKATDAGISDEWLDINQIAQSLGTYPEAVRFLAKRGWISCKNRDLENRKRLIAGRAAVEKFNREYILAGVLAKEIQMNNTNLAEKLMELGATAVSGPNVDGALVYLFRRDEVNKTDLGVLRSLRHYKTNTGRRSQQELRAVRQESMGVLTAVEAAAALGIEVHKIKVLVRRGVLKRVSVLKRAVHLDKNSVEKLCRLLARKDLVSIEEAAAQISQKPSVFERLWVKRKIIKVYELGLWRRISLSALGKLSRQLEGRVTASEAGRIRSMHRSHLPNMERRGEVTSVKLGGKSGVRLYNRIDLEMQVR